MPTSSIAFDFFPASDNTLLVRFPGAASSDVNERVLGLWWQLQQRKQEYAILNLHPAYETLLIRFDPFTRSHAEIERVVRRAAEMGLAPVHERKLHLVPVCYGGEFGPDLAEVARLVQLTPEQVIKIHSSAQYRVYFLGFAPGFPYLGGMDHRIVVPRLGSPRKEVAAGSVAIADDQTGVYPVASPGGWRLIGRTPLKLFTPDAASPSLFLPGDRLRFVPITADEYREAL
jgi:inhibitor of KinA